MRAKTCVRAGGALGQLLLVVVLAVGVFVMHTLGHPEESSHSRAVGASHAAPMELPMVDGASTHDPLLSAYTHEPPMAMDMASLCVAVLFGVWVLAGLLKSAFARHREWAESLLAQVAVVTAPRPPPRGAPDLTELSVLRQ
nr:DUF6153 family protein [Streptomyces sp. SBE_14.2]